MRIGVPKEVKEQEYRVGLTPESVREFAAAGHELSVETGAGAGINATDQAYLAAGATIVEAARKSDRFRIFASCGRSRADKRVVGFRLHRRRL